MSVARIWDRFWWSLMIAIFVGLMWLKFIDPVFPHIIVGVLAALAAGGSYFVVGIVKMARQKRREKELEETAYRELLEELRQKEARHG